METRRLSAAEKGKTAVSEPYQAPRTARVRVSEPESAYLLQKHSLTLIGRITNPSVQKIWSLLPFFAERWATETRPVGSDLGQGMFQFQFTREEDLLRVLEKRPFQYAKWMVIVERWNPTMAPDFPSLIPFWIKVQGIPVHLWTEGTIKAIGADIGIYEEAEINSLSARMRVQVNGRLPLIMSSVVEFPKGEVTATLVYEQIGKHCSYCFRLDHEARDCLKAKAEKKEQLAVTESNKLEYLPHSKEEQAHPSRGRPPSGKAPASKYREASHFSPYSRPHRDQTRHHNNSYLSDYRQERDYNSRRSEIRDPRWRRSQDQHSLNRDWRSHSDHRPIERERHFTTLEDRAPSKSRRLPLSEDDNVESSASRRANQVTARGTPLQRRQEELPNDALEKTIGEIHNAMQQYTLAADPTESAARKERYRQAQESGEIEETAAEMVRASTIAQAQENPTPEDNMTVSPTRIPALLRLGPSPPLQQTEEGLTPQPTTRRKPGRPPGSKKKVPHSPKLLLGQSSKRRKVPPRKTTTARRKLVTQAGPRNSEMRAANSRDSAGRRTSTQDSENQPLVNMIPATTKKKKKTDFRSPSTLVP